MLGERIREIRKTDSKRFERAHVDLSRLLGYTADNSENDGGPDPWWIVGDFCLAAEDYKTDGKNPISLHKERQVNDHPTWITRMVPQLSKNIDFVRVIISPSTSVERVAVAISRDVTYWNQEQFVNWAQ
ncbi:hypothetical protein [Paenibacillus alkalitolerans]|uniref:hypothetical protein n=1 Tax=Paenibacillus alkalitolerans TaxID=2799335 RepID=UPI0018F2CAE6|nr:hypothetical protein [Paenibacillus alkalitolerans]